MYLRGTPVAAAFCLRERALGNRLLNRCVYEEGFDLTAWSVLKPVYAFGSFHEKEPKCCISFSFCFFCVFDNPLKYRRGVYIPTFKDELLSSYTLRDFRVLRILRLFLDFLFLFLLLFLFPAT